MIRRRPDSGWRAASFAVALFAITLNFLQPLAHAAVMRDGGPANAMWGVFCLAAVGQDDSQAPAPTGDKPHECCLGLVHAPVLAAPSAGFTVVGLASATIERLPATADVLAPVGIRDGPSQPRAPPLPA